MAQYFRRITINESFRGQRVTGQQRYAGEIASRLATRRGVDAREPGRWFTNSGLKTWAWVLGILPLVTSRRVLLTLTSRGPLLHRRQVVVVHDLFVLTNPQWYSKKYALTHDVLLRISLKSARAVIAVSEPVAQQLRRSGLTKATITVAPNAPSEVFTAANARSDASDLLNSLGLYADRFLLVVGSLDPRKNLARLAEAYEGLPDTVRDSFPLVVVGGGAAAVFGDVGVRWPAEAVMAGYVDDADLALLYRNARAVVFPSLAEGFGLPIVEAAVCDARLAVSDIEIFRWIGGQSISYFDALSVDSMRASLLELTSEHPPAIDPDFAESVRSRFDWQKSADVVMAACLEVARR